MSAGRLVSLIYPDGSCLDCGNIFGAEPAFTPDSAVLSVVSAGRLWEYGIDGLSEGPGIRMGVSDAVWSGRGVLAVVRTGEVWVGSPHALHRLGSGSDPSWSPTGTRLAVVRGGWITVLDSNGRAAVRLVRGRSPAWSPDGRSIAFLARGNQLRVFSLVRMRSRAVGGVHGLSVAWQPIPRTRASGCESPPDSTTIASSSAATVTSRSFLIPGTIFRSSSYLGCLLGTGREYLLDDLSFQSEDTTSTITDAAVAGRYAALVELDTDQHYGGSIDTVKVFDLTSGTLETRLGGEQVYCDSPVCSTGLDDLVLSPTGVTAAHTIYTTYGTFDDQTEEIVARDRTGTHVLDTAESQYPSAPPTQPGPTILTHLQLNGSTLTWQHDGITRSAHLAAR